MSSKELAWKSIETEEYRIYLFDGGESVKIDNPVKLNISDSGGHRIVDSEGISYYIPPYWNCIKWKANPPFSF